MAYFVVPVIIFDSNEVRQICRDTFSFFEGCIRRAYLEDVFGGCIWNTYWEGALGGRIWRALLEVAFGGRIWRAPLESAFGWPFEGRFWRAL